MLPPPPLHGRDPDTAVALAGGDHRRGVQRHRRHVVARLHALRTAHRRLPVRTQVFGRARQGRRPPRADVRDAGQVPHRVVAEWQKILAILRRPGQPAASAGKWVLPPLEHPDREVQGQARRGSGIHWIPHAHVALRPQQAHIGPRGTRPPLA